MCHEGTVLDWSFKPFGRRAEFRTLALQLQLFEVDEVTLMCPTGIQNVESVSYTLFRDERVTDSLRLDVRYKFDTFFSRILIISLADPRQAFRIRFWLDHSSSCVVFYPLLRETFSPVAPSQLELSLPIAIERF